MSKQPTNLRDRLTPEQMADMEAAMKKTCAIPGIISVIVLHLFDDGTVMPAVGGRLSLASATELANAAKDGIINQVASKAPCDCPDCKARRAASPMFNGQQAEA